MKPNGDSSVMQLGLQLDLLSTKPQIGSEDLEGWNFINATCLRRCRGIERVLFPEVLERWKHVCSDVARPECL